VTGGKRQRVAIIGGGPAGLAAAFELTDANRDTEYEVTIFQQGWLLGGKCASGRNPDPGYGDRIEEHGLHIWFGCYENVHSVLDRCYEELKDVGHAPRFGPFKEALEGVDTIVLGQYSDRQWDFNELVFPRNRTPPQNFGDFVNEVLGWVARGLVDARRLIEKQSEEDLGWHDDVRSVLRDLELGEPDEGEWFDGIQHAASRLSRQLTEIYLDLGRAARAAVDPVERLDRFGTLVDGALPGLDREDPRVTFYRDTVRIVFTMLRGVWEDRLLDRGFSYINDRDLAEWLCHHGLGLPDDPLEWPTLLRAVYDGCFAFYQGDPSQPLMAAGRALQGAVRCCFHYGGSVLFRPRSSMSDILIAPLAQRLAQRGVDIRYFHPVRRLRLSNDRRRVELDVVQQLTDDVIARVVDLIYPDGHDGAPRWPSKLPDELGIDSSTRLMQEIDPFDHDEPVEVGDFDYVILAVPPDVQREICRDLVTADPKYARMLAHASSVATQAGQLWLSETAEQLGQDFRSDSLLSCYVEAIDTYADMGHLTEFEAWPPETNVRHIAYFCGVLPHAGVADQAAADARAMEQLSAFLDESVHRIWPEGVVGRHSTAFNESLFVPTGAKPPLAGQYTRANWAPTERYVLTLPGSVQYRLPAQGTRFENLVLAGDWTKNGFDAGCLEAAVTSGRLAAQAICGFPRPDDIPGVNGPPGFPSERAGGGSPVGDVCDDAVRFVRLVMSTTGGALRLLRTGVTTLPRPRL
jgi:uncharacterized protein with NAD-binding domain and iron-sulfur cluster